ncbi:unnamed protein product [Sphagnum jensenii]|uniref:Uncharacterized protein n=1 Tax=Sphagnum jensenii TaxID=128206 RepID=A0ABP0WS60_9BRYO
MFNAHINVEVSINIWSVKYLFKYVYKGPSCVAMKCCVSIFNWLWSLTLIEMYSMVTLTRISHGSTFARKELSL